jgi:hypothetical protein
VGGGGRFLLLHFPTLRKLGLFDVNAAALVHYFPLAEDEVRFAAGVDKLVLMFPDSRIVQRWDLHTRQLELTTPVPVPGAVLNLAMGAASNGPVYVGSGFKHHFHFARVLDLKTFRIVQNAGDSPSNVDLAEGVLSVSDDGKTVGIWRPHLSPQGMRTFYYTDGAMKTYYEHRDMGHLVPGPDGEFIYTGISVLDRNLKSLSWAPAPAYNMPVSNGPFFLSIPIKIKGPPKFGIYPPPKAKGPFPVQLQQVGQRQPMLTLLNLPDAELDLRDNERLSLCKRMHLILAADLFVYLPSGNDRLILHRLDLDEALWKAAVPLVLVTSQPPHARRGQPYQYQVKAKTAKGGLKYQLKSGPDGMQVSANGLLTWQVPADYSKSSAGVILTVSDQAGAEIFHAFSLIVKD